MTIPTPYLWEDDVTVTASLMNANVRDPQSWLLGLPTFMAHNDVETTVTTAVLKVPLNTVDVNVGGFTQSADKTKVYVPETGWYRWIALGGFDQTTYGNTDNRGVWVYKNGTWQPGGGYTCHTDTATNENTFGGRTALTYATAGDYFELGMYQSTPSATDTHTCVGYTENEPALTLLWQGRDA